MIGQFLKGAPGGFSLIEVTVAAGIMSIVAIGMATALTKASKAQDNLERRLDLAEAERSLTMAIDQVTSSLKKGLKRIPFYQRRQA